MRITASVARAWGASLALTFALSALWPRVEARTPQFPAQLTDKEFWELSELVSETNGEFQSDNFLSNERGYQVAIPELLKRAKPGRVYLGVGPEQNYPYILALKPQIAIIFDVRRGNLHEQLLYKALFELSADRAEFLARLFSMPKLTGVTATSTARELFDAVYRQTSDKALFEAAGKKQGGRRSLLSAD